MLNTYSKTIQKLALGLICIVSVTNVYAIFGHSKSGCDGYEVKLSSELGKNDTPNAGGASFTLAETHGVDTNNAYRTNVPRTINNGQKNVVLGKLMRNSDNNEPQTYSVKLKFWDPNDILKSCVAEFNLIDTVESKTGKLNGCSISGQNIGCATKFKFKTAVNTTGFHMTLQSTGH